MKDKKVIYTDSANERLELLFYDLRKKINNHFLEKKYVFGDDQIEVTASDIEEVSKRIKLFVPKRRSSVQLILIIYSVLGVFIFFFGLFYGEIKNIIESGGSFRFAIIISGILLTVFSVIYLYYRNMITSRQEVGVSSDSSKFVDLLEVNKERFVDLIKQHNQEIRVKGNKRIMVLSRSEADLNFLKSFFKIMEFKNIQYEVIESNDQILSTDDFDLVFFNNESGNLDLDFIVKQISVSSSDTMFFYFGSRRLNDVDEYRNRIAIANSRVQLYSNLINALIFQDLLK